MNIKSKVVRVTATEFELDDGRVFQHVVPLDPVPTPKEFQAFYDKASEMLKPMRPTVLSLMSAIRADYHEADGQQPTNPIDADGQVPATLE